MRSVGGVVVFCLCLLSVGGCAPSKQQNEEAEAKVKKELADLQADRNMLVPDWYRAEYTYWVSGYGIGNIQNKHIWRMLGLHLLLWLFVSMGIGWYSESKEWGDGGEVAPMAFGIGTVGLLALWVVVWLLCSILVPIFAPGSYIPFSFLGFLLTAGLWIAVISVGGVLLIHLLARNMIGGKVTWGSGANEPASSSVMGVRIPAATRRGRILRAMLKALFVAVASAIGGRIGGWVGGILVFVISAGVSSYFELPPSDTDHSHHPDPHH
jgi:hypothetical protein